jgi:hypothetical protein
MKRISDKMNIGLDIHGVIDKYPASFANLSKSWVLMGHKIHIITGQSWELAKETVLEHKILYHAHYSIVDYHKENKDVDMWQDEKDDWWMPKLAWNISKGIYCKENHIDVHFDDEVDYAKYMPDTCSFVLVDKHTCPLLLLFKHKYKHLEI